MDENKAWFIVGMGVLVVLGGIGWGAVYAAHLERMGEIQAIEGAILLGTPPIEAKCALIKRC